MGNHYTVVACGSGGEAGYIARSSYTRRHCPCIVIIGCRSAAWGGCNGCSSTGTYTWWVHRYTWCSCKAHCAGGRRRYTTCCLMGNHYTVVACGSGGEAGYIARSSYTRRHCPCIVIIGCRSAASVSYTHLTLPTSDLV